MTIRGNIRGWMIPALVLAGAGMALATSDPNPTTKTGTPSSAGKPEACKVSKGPFQTTLALKGVFEAQDMHEVSIHPKSSGDSMMPIALVVESAVAHGATVKKGDVLVQLKHDKLDKAIKEAKEARELASLSLKEAEDEMPLFEKTLPMDLADAERAKRHADEDYKRWLDVDLPLAKESADQMVKMANYRLESAREELKQLQSMYRAKDLTEETEEYILKRQRQEVKDAEFYLKSAKIQNHETLTITLPRRDKAIQLSTIKTALALTKLTNSFPITLAQKKLALAKQRADFKKGGQQLAHLEADRKALTVRSPADGIVYYGKCSSGQWSAPSMMEGKLKPRGVLMPDEVFMTVVSPRPLLVRANVDEKDLHLLKPEVSGKAIPTGWPRLKIPARLTSVSAVPQGPGKFEALIALEMGPDATAVMPGMACDIKFVAYHKDDALTVPATAVFSEGEDDDAHYVYLAKGHGKHPVQVGETVNGKTEIVSGLKAGDEILTAKPQS